MTPELRMRALLAWAHLYFFLSFRSWYGTAQSFSIEGLASLKSLPLWYLEAIPRMPQSLVVLVLEFLMLLSLAGAYLSSQTKTIIWSRRLLLALLLGKLYFYSLDLRVFSTFHHMHLLMVCLLLLSPKKLFPLRLGLILVYVISGLGKLNDSWLEADYFHSLGSGLPLLGANPKLLLAASWFVILLELLVPWLWLTGVKRLRKSATIAFLIFHIYSGLIVGFYYNLLMIPLLLLLCWPSEESAQSLYRWETKDIPVWFFLASSLALLLSPVFISTDVRYTAEGRYFSFANMFDANRSIRFEARFEKNGVPYHVVVLRDYPKNSFYDAKTLVMLSQNREPLAHLREALVVEGQVLLQPELFQRTHLRVLGDPYLYLYASQEICRRIEPDKLSAHLESALNGSGEMRTVFRFDDLCTTPVSYQPWGGNKWLSK